MLSSKKRLQKQKTIKKVQGHSLYPKLIESIIVSIGSNIPDGNMYLSPVPVGTKKNFMRSLFDQYTHNGRIKDELFLLGIPHKNINVFVARAIIRDTVRHMEQKRYISYELRKMSA